MGQPVHQDKNILAFSRKYRRVKIYYLDHSFLRLLQRVKLKKSALAVGIHLMGLYNGQVQLKKSMFIFCEHMGTRGLHLVFNYVARF